MYENHAGASRHTSPRMQNRWAVTDTTLESWGDGEAASLGAEAKTGAENEKTGIESNWQTLTLAWQGRV